MPSTRRITPAISLEDLDAQLEEVRAEVRRRISAGQMVAVTIADEREELTPREAAERLGFSRQHVRRLVDAGELDAHRLPNSKHWRIPLTAILAFEERRAAAEKRADEHSRALDDLGAPLE